MPTYDANGNLTAIGSATYSYDAPSLLVAADGPPEANPGPMTNILNITRDTRRRITRLQHNAQTTYRIYDNWNLIAEYAPSGTLIKEQIHGTRIDEILLTISANGSGTYHHHDALGNVVALTNAASYAVLETYTYDPFGKRTVYNATGQQIPDTAYANTHGYTGREHLPLSGLMDYRNRSYSTTLGRFLQTDPIRFNAGDVNLYRHVGNCPIDYFDAFGLYKKRRANRDIPGGGGSIKIDIIDVDKCEIVILYGHGNGVVPHEFNFPSSGCSAGEFVGCRPGRTNSEIPNNKRLDNPDMSSDTKTISPVNDTFHSAMVSARDRSESKAKSFCENNCCDKVKIRFVKQGGLSEYIILPDYGACMVHEAKIYPVIK